MRTRIAHLSNAELLQMVNLDHEQYRKEALDCARAEMERRGLKIEPVTFANAPVEAEDEAAGEAKFADEELEVEAAGSEYLETDAMSEQEAVYASAVEFKVFRGEWASWDELFSEAAAFATEIGSLRLINISHSADKNVGVVTVWYWT
ncbi:MAG TPA: hypothetical protein VF703_11980 [Pyrinomonadaceae bacterium]